MFLTVLDGPASGRVIDLDQLITVGRDADCAIVLDDDDRVSRRHATFEPQSDGTVRVTDLGSTNGVYVGSLRITAPASVHSGDTVRIGHTSLGLRATDPSLEPATSPSSGPATVIGIDEPPAPSGTAERAAQVVVSAGRPVSNTTPPPPPGATTRSRGRRPVATIGAAVVIVAGLVAVALVVATRDRGATADSVAEQAARGVLQVQSEVDGQLIGTGTGWVYDIDQGLVVTSYHVVGLGTTFTVGIGPDRRTATLVGAAPCDDLAVLRVDRIDDLTELPLGDQSELRSGQDVVALGYPRTASQTVVTSTGTISNPQSSFDAPARDLPSYPNVVVSNVSTNPGNSGGPLLDLEGRVVGVNTAGSAGSENQNHSIGADRLRKVLPDLAAGDSYGWNGLLLVFPSTAEEVEALGSDPALFGKAVFTTGAVPESSAADTGLFSEIDGAAVPIVGVEGSAMDGTLQTLCNSISVKRRGDTTTFNVTDGVDLYDFDLDFA
jgi:S1-C subfamily serine protease